MSLRQVINDKCRDCIYDPKCGGGHWREQVAQCSSTECSLWPYRRLPGSGRFANASTRIEDGTPEWRLLPVGDAVSQHPSRERT